MVNYIDLFSGIGGFRFGLDDIGFDCIMSSEINKYCRKTYKLNFKNYPEDDIYTIDENLVPNHELLVGGFPCQPFSICGNKKGFKDQRGNLFFEIIRIVKHKRPKVVFLENVKHLKNHDSGNTLKVILKELNKLGYQTSWKVLNGKNFNTPQSRERIIIIASLGKAFDFSKINESNNTKKINNILDSEGDFYYLQPNEYTILNQSLVKEQTSGLKFVGYRNKTIRKNGVRENTNHLSRVHRQPNRIYCSSGTHPTIPSQETSGRFFIYHEGMVRKLTLNECYKLNGFPKNFKNESPITEQYKQVGNSVVVPMIKAIGREIKIQYFT
jgi:DNA (cytosine-5)-methyltransferase 1